MQNTTQNNTATKPQLGPYQEGVKKALKQAGEQHALEAVQSGVPASHIEQQSGLTQATQAPQSQAPSAAFSQDPNQVLAQIANLANTKQPVPGTAIGLEGTLWNLITGKGLKSPLSPVDSTLGLDTALKVLDYSRNLEETQRRNKTFVLRSQQIEADTANKVLNLAKERAQTLGDTSLLDALGANQVQDSGASINPAFRKEYGQAEVEILKESRKDLNQYTRQVTPIMTNILKFQDIAEKLPDYKGGIINQMIARGDTVAKAMAADPQVVRLNAVIDRSLGGLVKFGGDTGNLAEQEQQRAKKAIGATNLPLKEKIQIYNDTLEQIFNGLDVRVEQAQDRNYQKRFPVIAKARDRFRKNQEMLAKNDSEDINSFLQNVSKSTGAKITYSESE